MIDTKLESFAEREIYRNLRTIILDDGQGRFVVFGRYRMCPEKQGYAVYTLADDLVGIFSSKRTAMSWCVADNYNQLNLARNLKTLDHERQMRLQDINCSRTLSTLSRRAEHAEIVDTKLQAKLERYDSVVKELEKCVNLAKYLQIRGFNNETARTSGNDSYKTSI